MTSEPRAGGRERAWTRPELREVADPALLYVAVQEVAGRGRETAATLLGTEARVLDERLVRLAATAYPYFVDVQRLLANPALDDTLATSLLVALAETGRWGSTDLAALARHAARRGLDVAPGALVERIEGRVAAGGADALRELAGAGTAEERVALLRGPAATGPTPDPIGAALVMNCVAELVPALWIRLYSLWPSREVAQEIDRATRVATPEEREQIGEALLQGPPDHLLGAVHVECASDRPLAWLLGAETWRRLGAGFRSESALSLVTTQRPEVLQELPATALAAMLAVLDRSGREQVLRLAGRRGAEGAVRERGVGR